MQNSLTEKVIIITGATRGYGLAVAQALLKVGAIVVLTGRSQKAINDAISKFSYHKKLRGFELDVSNEEQIYSVIQNVHQEFGRIDIWINNAGFSNAAGQMLDMNPQDITDMFLANNLGVFLCTQAIVQYMRPQKQGMIVNIYGHGSSLRPASPTGLYGATKAWVTSFTRSLAVELKASGIQLLGFNPGMMTTDMLTNPNVVGEKGKEMMINYSFVLGWLSRSPQYGAIELVKSISKQEKDFDEVDLIKPWTLLFGLLRVFRNKIFRINKTPQFTLNSLPVYKSKYLN